MKITSYFLGQSFYFGICFYILSCQLNTQNRDKNTCVGKFSDFHYVILVNTINWPYNPPLRYRAGDNFVIWLQSTRSTYEIDKKINITIITLNTFLFKINRSAGIDYTMNMWTLQSYVTVYKRSCVISSGNVEYALSWEEPIYFPNRSIVQIEVYAFREVRLIDMWFKEMRRLYHNKNIQYYHFIPDSRSPEQLNFLK